MIVTECEGQKYEVKQQILILGMFFQMDPVKMDFVIVSILQHLRFIPVSDLEEEGYGEYVNYFN